MTALWPWLALAGLGAFHGLNPAMGWLFAVGLGMQRRDMSAVLWALPPLAIGHAASIAVVAGAMTLAGLLIQAHWLYRVAGLLLIAWAAYHHVHGHRHAGKVSPEAGFAGLTLWSFAMATAHGAGLMVLPVMMPLCIGTSPLRDIEASGSLPMTLTAVGLHTGAMLIVTATVAMAVYRGARLALPRRGEAHRDRLWTGALTVTGVVLLFS